MQNRNKRSGFTMIELLTVIAILGILMAIFLPTFVRGRFKAYHAGCIENMHGIQTAMESYQVDNQRYPDVLSRLATGGNRYLNIISDCPSMPGVQYGGALYEVTLDGKSYTLSCPGVHYLQLGMGRQFFPQISAQGHLVAE